MTCTRPIHGFRAPGGQVKFNPHGAWVDRPVTVSCGQCSSCRLLRSSSWALRCVHEATLHEHNSFITLTYDGEHLPFDGSLDISHWQKFARDLRKSVGKFRYLHCGEYGDENFRPHYHACIFGLDFLGDREFYKEKGGFTIYTSELLDQTWGRGMCTVGSLSFESAAYVARYVMKKMTGPMAPDHYRTLDPVTGEEFQLKPEYCTMSRKPGLGADWIRRWHKDVYPDDFVVHDGRKFRPPSFYDREMLKHQTQIA